MAVAHSRANQIEGCGVFPQAIILSLGRRFRAVLESDSRFDVCGEATDRSKAIELALRLKPDVVVLNVGMPVLSAFEAAREIKTTLPESAIVILSSNSDKHFVEEDKKRALVPMSRKTRIGEALIKAISDAVEFEGFVLLK